MSKPKKGFEIDKEVPCSTLKKYVPQAPFTDDDPRRCTRLLTKLEGEQGEGSEPWSWFWEDVNRQSSWQLERSSIRSTSTLGQQEQLMQAALAAQAGRRTGTENFAYIDGERVEYYSKTNGMWLHADIFTEWQQDAKCAMYSVRMRGSNQRRRGVGFELLRMPLQKGEPCEVFSVKDGWWLAAKIAGSVAGSVPGYEVKISASDMPGSPTAVSMVSAAVVRRYFPVYSRLVVYRGTDRGWAEAVAVAPSCDRPGSGGAAAVESDALRRSSSGESQMGAVESWAPEDGIAPRENSSSNLEMGDSILGPTPSTLSQATIAPAGSLCFRGPRKPDGSPLDCWVMVPLQEKGCEEKELVPSYLVRLHPEHLEDLAIQDSSVRVTKEFDEEDERQEAEADFVEVPEPTPPKSDGSIATGWWPWCTCLGPTS